MGSEDEEEGLQRVRLSQKAPVCACPALIAEAAKRQSVSCQEIFREAFRDPCADANAVDAMDPLARAMFVQFIACGMDEALIPRVVAEYCRMTLLQGMPPAAKSGFCFGCMLNMQMWHCIQLCYKMAFPLVTPKFLMESAEKKPIANGSQEEVSDEVLVALFQDMEGTDGTDSDGDWMHLSRLDE